MLLCDTHRSCHVTSHDAVDVSRPGPEAVTPPRDQLVPATHVACIRA